MEESSEDFPFGFDEVDDFKVDPARHINPKPDVIPPPRRKKTIPVTKAAWKDSFWNIDAKDGKGKEWKDAFWKYAGKESITESSEEMETEKSWKEVSWDKAREEAAKQIEQVTSTVDVQVREKYETDAGAYWEKFYQKNQNKFFRDRHYLHYQFDDLKWNSDGTSKLKNWKIMEVGCGTGCTLFPLLESHKESFFYVFDFSEQAVELVKTSEQYDERRCKAFVCDVNTQELPDYIEPNSLDMIIMVFVLSAINPDDMPAVLKKLLRYLKPGGIFLVRDYGVYDMTHVRFLYKEGRKLGDNYYVRADGTRVFYFTTDSLSELFEKCGYQTATTNFDTRELRNRKKMINMYRVWVNGKFIKPETKEEESNK